MKPNGLFVSNEAKRLKELESENVRLKRLVATQALDLDMLRRCGTSISNSTKPPTGGRSSCSTSSMNTPGKPWPRGLAGPIPLTTPSTIDDVADLMAKHRPPKYIRMDNGPEMIAWTLRDHCRTAGVRTSYINPASPWQNPIVESFNGRVRGQLDEPGRTTAPTVARTQRDTLLRAPDRAKPGPARSSTVRRPASTALDKS